MGKEKLQVHMFLDPAPSPDAPEQRQGHQIWACRGKGKCLEPAPSRRVRHCDDCVLARADETMAKLLERMDALPDPE